MTTLSLAATSVGSRLLAPGPYHKTARDLVQLQIDNIAHREVPIWLAAHEDRTCPRPAELVPGEPELANDWWGHEIVVLCDADRNVYVQSRGPDGKLGTTDDLVSR